MGEFAILFWCMYIAFQALLKICGCRAFCCCRSLFVLTVPFSPAATFRGRRLGEGGECSSQLQLYLCPAVDSPLSAALSPVKRGPFFFFPKQPNLSRSLIQIGVILSGGWCLPLERTDYGEGRWKAKMQMILNLLWVVVPPFAFLHLFISWSHFLLVQGLPGVPLTSHSFSLISSSLDLLSALHYLFSLWFSFAMYPLPLVLSLFLFVSLFLPSWQQTPFNVWTTQHRPHVNM